MRALDESEGYPSLTEQYGRTPEPGRDHWPPTEDLLGTWVGTTTSEWIVKDRSGDRAGTKPTFMTMDGDAHTLRVEWLYRHGVSTAVTCRLARDGMGRRVLALYEAYVLDGLDRPHAARAADPTHRGACLLSIHPSPDGLRAAGPYWTDRGTNGWLSFTWRDSRLATAFSDAETAFGLSVDEAATTP